MRKVGDLMKDLGFNANSSEDVQKAFIKNLVRQAYGVEVKELTKDTPVPDRAPVQPQQLSFDLSDKKNQESA